MKKNFRESKTAVEKLINEATEKMLISMVPQPPPPQDKDAPRPPPSMPDEATQSAVKTAMDHLRRNVTGMLEDFADADMQHHKKEVKAKAWEAEVSDLDVSNIYTYSARRHRPDSL